MKKTWISLLSILLLMSLSMGSALATEVHPGQMGDVGGALANQYGQQYGQGYQQPGFSAPLPQGENIFYSNGSTDSSLPPWQNGTSTQSGTDASRPPWETGEGVSSDERPPWETGANTDSEVGEDPNVPFISNPNSGVVIVEPGQGTGTGTSSGVQSLDWYGVGFDLINKYKNITVRDLNTGVTWNAKYINGKNHADVIPASESDLQKLTANNITGDYVRRPVVVTINGTSYAGSMYAVGHGDTSYCNYFSGVMCIHFTGSQTHGSQKVDSDHQNAIQQALQNGGY